MKKLLYLIVLLMSVSVTKAQHFEITPTAGYTFGDKFPIAGGYGRIGDGFTYGGILSYVVSEHNSFEVSYSHQDATGLLNTLALPSIVSGPVGVNYFFIGGSRLFPMHDELVLFTGLNMGGANFVSKNSSIRSNTKFALGLNAGGKFYFSEHIGIRLQANLNFPVSDTGVGYWWDPVSGGSFGVTSNVPLLQFGFTGGLIIKI